MNIKHFIFTIKSIKSSFKNKRVIFCCVVRTYIGETLKVQFTDYKIKGEEILFFYNNFNINIHPVNIRNVKDLGYSLA